MKNYHDGGEAILEAFRNLGVDFILSSPGSEWSPVWEAMARQTVEKNDGPKFIDCWHENVAVDMALGYTAVTGKMQAVLVHAGVGLMHGAMAMLSAWQAEMPMLVLSGGSVSYGDQPGTVVEPQWYGGVSTGGADRMVAAIVKHASHVSHPDTIYQSIIRGGELAQRPQMGPVYIDLSLDAMLAEWKRPSDLKAVPTAPRLAPLEQDVKQVAKLLAAARSPVVIADLAGRDPRTHAALVELADALALPVIGGRSLIVYSGFPQNNPMWQGWDNTKVLDGADLVLLIGGRTPWYPPSAKPAKAKIVSIGDNPIKHHLPYQVLGADHYLEGDAATALAMLLKAAKPGKADAARIKERRAHWTKAHETRREQLAAMAAKERAEPGPGIGPLALASIAAEVLPPDTIHVDETITHMPVMKDHLALNGSQSLFRVTGGALGQGIATSLGIKLAARDRPVVLFSGDGSFLYNPILQAFGASKSYELPIVIVVCNNGKYEAMRKGHVLHYPGGVSDTTKLHYGVNIQGPNYHELGREFGFHGAKVEKVSELAGALREAIAATRSGRSAIVNVMMSR